MPAYNLVFLSALSDLRGELLVSFLIRPAVFFAGGWAEIGALIIKWLASLILQKFLESLAALW